MNKYIGLNTVNADPMNRKEYSEFRGWELPSDEDGSDEGYLVEYVDGGKANTDSFDGYISWLPKDVFDGHYRKCDTYQDRVCIEKKDIDSKIKKLELFISNEEFTSMIDSRAQSTMIDQLSVMKNLSKILGDRIFNFSNSGSR